MAVDTQLIKSAKLGDKDSFSKIYEQYAGELYKFALYTLGNTHDAQDVVSEAFIEAYKNIKNLRDEASFKGWIFKILSIRCKRKIGAYIKKKNEYDLEDFLDLPSDPGELSTDLSEKISLLQVLETLKEQERQIVILAVVQGYTTKETAQILGLPHGTVSSKLHRTLIKMREKLS